MRVVVITTWPTKVKDGSGTAVFFNALVNGLQQRNYDVEVIAPNFDTTDYVEATLKRFLFNTDLRTDPRVRSADLVIGLDYDGYGLDPANRPPTLISAHAVYGDVIQWEVEPFRTMVQAQAFFDRVAMERSDHITIGSRYAKDRVVAVYAIPPEKITVIPHGMPTPSWLPLVEHEPRRANDHPILLAVGKMFPRKRIDVLLRAVAILRQRYSAIDLRIVGDGLDWDRLHALADELQLGRNVTWLGHMTQDAQFAAEWRQADVFCHASNQETFGFVYLEAMMLGKPIVAARAGAAPEVLNGVGLLVEPGSPEAFAEGVSRFLDEPALGQDYGRRAREYAKRFTHDRMLDGYVALIEQLTTSKSVTGT